MNMITIKIKIARKKTAYCRKCVAFRATNATRTSLAVIVRLPEFPNRNNKEEE